MGPPGEQMEPAGGCAKSEWCGCLTPARPLRPADPAQVPTQELRPGASAIWTVGGWITSAPYRARAGRKGAFALNINDEVVPELSP